MSNAFCLFLLLISPAIFGQSEFTIQGTIKDRSEEPVFNALITLQNNADSSILSTAFPDGTGRYLIHSRTIADASLKVSALGFATKWYDFSENESRTFENGKRKLVLDFKLDKEENQLEEVVVSDTKPLFEQKIDRMVFNVANSLSAAGSDALDMLGKAPGVFVDPLSNSIRLIGKGGVQVMVNGRLLRLSGADLVAYLQSISADQIDRIEVITNPPAKYDASGSSGLIDIILKKDNNTGLNGLIRGGYEQASYGKVIGGGNLNFRKDRWNVYGNVNYSKAKNQIIERLNTPYTSGSLHMIDDHLRTLEPLSYTFGLDFEVHKNGFIGLMVQGSNIWRNDDDHITNRIITLREDRVDSLMQTLGTSHQYRENYNANLNYEWRIDTAGRKLSINANQLLYAGTRWRQFGTEHYFGEFESATGILSENKLEGGLDLYITTAQADLALPYRWAALSFGIKMSRIQNKSSNRFLYLEDGQFRNDPTVSNAFDYTENIQAFYGSVQREIGSWGFQAGLRGEYTRTKGYSLSLNQTHANQYFQLFPTAYLKYKFNAFNTLNLNYSKRIHRPGYQELDPFKSYTSPYFYSEGNPFLQPFFSHNLELRYSYNYRYFLSAFYQLSKHSSGQIWLADPLTQVTSSHVGNYFDAQSFGLSMVASLQPKDWWELSGQASFAYRQLSSDYYPEFVQSTLPAFNLYLNSSLALNRSKSFLAEISGYYYGKSQMGFFEWEPFYGLNLGLKGLFFEQNLVLTIQVNDVFNSLNNREARNIYSGQTLRNDLDQQHIRVTVSCKFGNKKLKSARTRKTGIEDEKGRM